VILVFGFCENILYYSSEATVHQSIYTFTTFL